MYFRALSTSFLIHSMLILAMLLFEKPQNASDSKNNLVEVEFIDISGPQVVSEALAPNLDLLNQDPTRYQSKAKQRVEKEQLASKSGKTQNRSRFKKISPSLLPPLDPNTNGTASISDLNDKKSNLKVSRQDQIRDQVKQNDIYENLFKKRGVSSIQDRVFKDLEYGHFTSLNTDSNKFYSFYERINDQVRIRWTENVERQLSNLKLRSPSQKIHSKEWLSRVVVVLNLEGDIITSYISKTSGNSHWDEAALKAFRKAAPFINPPRAMAEEDGKIRLRYLFSLKL